MVTEVFDQHAVELFTAPPCARAGVCKARNRSMQRLGQFGALAVNSSFHGEFVSIAFLSALHCR